MAMTKEEKQNVIVALGLSVAAVIIIWLWNRGQSSVVTNPAAADQNIFPGSDAGSQPQQGYTNYNLPAYTGPGVNVGGSNITNNPANSNNGCGCGVPCGPPGTYLGNGWSVAQYLMFAGP